MAMRIPASQATYFRGYPQSNYAAQQQPQQPWATSPKRPFVSLWSKGATALPLRFAATHRLEPISTDLPAKVREQLPVVIEDEYFTPGELADLKDYYNQLYEAIDPDDIPLGKRKFLMSSKEAFADYLHKDITVNVKLQEGTPVSFEFDPEHMEEPLPRHIRTILEKGLTKFIANTDDDVRGRENLQLWYTLFRYTLPIGKQIKAVKWHSHDANYLGVLTLETPPVHSGRYQVRLHPKVDLRDLGLVDTDFPHREPDTTYLITDQTPRNNTMIITKDGGVAQHRVTPLRSTTTEPKGDVEFRDLFTVGLYDPDTGPKNKH